MITKSEAKEKVKAIAESYEESLHHFKENPPTEQDLQRNYILPMLEALNWNIYDLKAVRQEKFIGDIQPDISLFDEAGNVICIEVKPDYQPLNPENNLKKYTPEKVQQLQTRVVLLTSFKNSQLHIFSEKHKKPTIKKMAHSHYYPRFDTLWKWLSNTKEGIRTRGALKAHVTRD